MCVCVKWVLSSEMIRDVKDSPLGRDPGTEHVPRMCGLWVQSQHGKKIKKS